MGSLAARTASETIITSCSSLLDLVLFSLLTIGNLANGVLSLAGTSRLLAR